MGITFGDHLIDCGYRDITPEQEREIEAMDDARLLSNPYEVGGTEYELWGDGHGNWSLIRNGEEADLAKFTVQQRNQIAQDVFELRAK